MASQSLIEYAPSGVSAFSGPSIGFTHASGDQLVVDFRIPLCSLASPGNGITFAADHIPGIVIQGNTGTLVGPRQAQTIALTPTAMAGVTNAIPNYQSFAAFPDCNFLGLIAQAFSRYKMESMELEYMPTTTTVDPTNFSLVFNADANHPVVGMDASLSPGLGVTYTTAKNSVNSVNFACWSTWKKKMPVDVDQEYYTDATIRKDIGTFPYSTLYSPFNNSELRLSHFGALSVLCNQQNTATIDNLMKGELYMSGRLRLFDMTPISSTQDIPFSLRQYISLIAGDKLMWIDDKDDSEEKGVTDPAPPKFRPLPGGASSVNYRIITGGRAAHKLNKPSPIVRQRAVRTRVERKSVQPPRQVTAPSVHRLQPKNLMHVIGHLQKSKSRLPAAAQLKVTHLRTLASKKPKAWKTAAKSIVKDLVKEVPVVGGVLGELTDKVGGKLLDWLEDLF